MKIEINENQLEEINGGNVVLSGPLKLCGFSTLGKSYRIKGDIKLMRNRLLELYDQNENMSSEAFDLLVEQDFIHKGWI